MGDYGAAVSQKGYDIKTCADRFLVYSSAFHGLKIFNTYTASTTIPTDPNINTITITHNLGYIAPCIILYNMNSDLLIDNEDRAYFFSDSYGQMITHRMKVNTLEIDVDQWIDDPDYGNHAGATAYFTVYIFAEDFAEFEGSVINTGISSGESSVDYGFRISKPGFDVKTCANKDCVLTSSKASMIVHKKGEEAGVPITHSLGYIPSSLTYAYSEVDGELSFTPAFSIYDNRIEFVDSTVLYVIFKDKLNG